MSRPFLCECGILVNVADIPAGERFRCPSCGQERTLDPSDPGLLAHFTDSEGMYHLLLEQRMAEEGEMHEAEPVPARGPDTATRSLSPPIRAATALPTSRLGRDDCLGPFLIAGILGQGGMGIVYEALDTALQRAVALKVLGEEHARNAEVVDRFHREARAAGSLSHPNITTIYSIGEDRGYHYFAMELVRGVTLSQLLGGGKRLTEESAIDYLLQVAHGLRAAKRKRIIHRDIKPSNLIASEDGLVKITDFGLAKVVTSPIDITATGVIVGTPLYMSPEQGKGELLDHRSDIYSLGCTFYHLLCGEPPFPGETGMNIIVRHITDEPTPLTSRECDVSPRMAEIIHRMMQKNPLDRFQDYDELIEAISQLTSLAASSTTRVQRRSGRVVLVSEKQEEAVPVDSMSRKQLSVADVNLELGRFDKALALYQRVLEENPHLEVDLAFRMLEIHQRQGNAAEAEPLYRKIAEQSTEPNERYFCRWKLLQGHVRRCLEELRTSQEIIEGMLAEERPAKVEERTLRQQLEDQKKLEKKLQRSTSDGLLLIRRCGDLQIELD